LLRIAANL